MPRLSRCLPAHSSDARTGDRRPSLPARRRRRRHLRGDACARNWSASDRERRPVGAVQRRGCRTQPQRVSRRHRRSTPSRERARGKHASRQRQVRRLVVHRTPAHDDRELHLVAIRSPALRSGGRKELESRVLPLPRCPCAARPTALSPTTALDYTSPCQTRGDPARPYSEVNRRGRTGGRPSSGSSRSWSARAAHPLVRPSRAREGSRSIRHASGSPMLMRRRSPAL